MSISNHPVEQEELMAYLDGELSAENAASTASHLEKCPECQKLADDLQEVSQMLTSWQVEASESELAGNVDETLERRGSDKTSMHHRAAWRSLLSPRFWPKPVWGLAVVGLIAVLVLIATWAPQGSLPKSHQVTAALQDAVRTPGKSAPVPTATPRPGVGSLGKLQRDETVRQDDVEGNEASDLPTSNGPMIVRTAELAVTTNQFDQARSAVEEILKRRHGYVGELNVSTPRGSARSLAGTLRVPASQLDATLADLKALGRVEKESQNGEEVTQQYVDLQARLTNARHTEQRLTDILRERTGKLSDVLAVELQISRVRGEIEQMEAQRKNMKNQVDFATLNVTVSEDYKAELKAVPPSTSTQFRNAAVEGYRWLVGGIISVLLWLLSVGPSLLLWAAILFFPARLLWKKLRPKFAK